MICSPSYFQRSVSNKLIDHLSITVQNNINHWRRVKKQNTHTNTSVMSYNNKFKKMRYLNNVRDDAAYTYIKRKTNDIIVVCCSKRNGK